MLVSYKVYYQNILNLFIFKDVNEVESSNERLDTKITEDEISKELLDSSEADNNITNEVEISKELFDADDNLTANEVGVNSNISSTTVKNTSSKA